MYIGSGCCTSLAQRKEIPSDRGSKRTSDNKKNLGIENISRRSKKYEKLRKLRSKGWVGSVCDINYKISTIILLIVSVVEDARRS